jgi:hypothetical protein
MNSTAAREAKSRHMHTPLPSKAGARGHRTFCLEWTNVKEGDMHATGEGAIFVVRRWAAYCATAIS